MIIKQTFETKNKTVGVNTCQFIVLHHTWSGEGSIKGLINAFTGQRQVSAHYLVDENGELYKFGDDKDILWHAGTSSWGKLTNLNRFSIGIEVIGPLQDGGFTDKQKETVDALVVELAKKYAIPKENILRHKDISPGRKWDIADTFWNTRAVNYKSYINNLFDKKEVMQKSKYTEILANVLKETGATPIFNSHEGEETLTEQETKELLEIWFARFSQRLQNAFKNLK